MVLCLLPEIEPSHRRIRRKCGDHANFLAAPGSNYNQNSLRIGFSHLHNALFALSTLQRHINGFIIYNLFSFVWAYTMLGNMVPIGVVPIEIHSQDLLGCYSVATV